MSDVYFLGKKKKNIIILSSVEYGHIYIHKTKLVFPTCSNKTDSVFNVTIVFLQTQHKVSISDHTRRLSNDKMHTVLILGINTYDQQITPVPV